MELLKPRIAVLDETDSGLDVDALGSSARVSTVCARIGDTGLLMLITHYTRILR